MNGEDAHTVAVALDGSLAGQTLAGRVAPGAVLNAGASAHAAVRPEDIEVAPNDRSPARGHTLVGVIEALLFVGDRYEARVALSAEQRILLFLGRGGDWREGQRLQFLFPARGGQRVAGVSRARSTVSPAAADSYNARAMTNQLRLGGGR